MSLNEADTRAQLIDPRLNRAGWTRSQVTREQYYRPDWAYTAGKNAFGPFANNTSDPRFLLDGQKKLSLNRDLYFAIYAYHKPLRTRADRAQDFRQREEPWLTTQEAQAREVILALIEKYELGGLKEMTNAGVFRVSPFREMGEVRGVINRFGGDAQRLRSAVDEIQRRLYAA